MSNVGVVNGKKMNFNGVNSYVKVENSLSIEPQNLTVLVLLELKSTKRADTICKLDGYAEGWRIVWNAQGNEHFLTEINYGDACPRVLYTNKRYKLGIHMVGFTYDHNNIKNYVDGQLDGTLAETRDINYTNSAYLTIGARNINPNFPFTGDIFLVAVFSEAKSDDWNKKFYNDYLHGKDLSKYIDDSCVLWYDGSSIDESNQVWRDRSKYHNDGQFNNMQVVRDVSRTNMSGLVFDGVDDYVDVPNNDSLNPTDEITVVASFIPLSGRTITFFPIGKTWNYTGYRIQRSRYASIGIGFIVSDGSSNITANSGVDVDWSKLNVIVGTAKANDTINVYKNGQLLASNSCGTWENSTNDLTVGRTLYYGGWTNMKGYVFAVYNEKKDDDWVKQFYNDLVNGKNMSKYWKDSSCVLWFDGDNIDEDNGIWYDKSGKGDNGTIYGAKLVRSLEV